MHGEFMLKTLLVGLVLLAAPLTAAPLLGETPLVPKSAPDAAPSPDRAPDLPARLELDGGAMPAGGGWFLVPVTASGPAEVTVEATGTWAFGGTGPFGHLVILDLPAPSEVFVHPFLLPEQGIVTIDHEDEHVVCCRELATMSGSGDHGAFGRAVVEAGQVFQVGLAANTWDPAEESIAFAVEAIGRDGPVTLEAGQAVHGPDVTVIDLVAAADHEAGGVAVGNVRIGETGETSVEHALEDPGVVAFQSYTFDGPLDASITLPDGTAHAHPTGPMESLQVWSLTPPGTLHASAGGYERSSPLTGDWSHVEALVLVAGAPVRHLQTHAVSTVDGLEAVLAAPGTTLRLDDSALPDSTGWFLVPLHADAPGTVNASFALRTEGERGVKGAAAFLLQPEYPTVSASIEYAHPMLSASVLGEALPTPEGLPPSSWSTGSGGQDIEFRIAPDAPVYIGLAVTDWSEDDSFELVLTSEASGLGWGDVVTGEHVEAIDLVDAARRAGTHVQFGGLAASAPADIERSFASEHGGIFAVTGWLSGDAEGELTIELPDGRVHTNAPGREVLTWGMGSLGPGTTTVSLTALDEGGPHVAGRASFAWAQFLWADVPVPEGYVYAFLDTSPTEE